MTNPIDWGRLAHDAAAEHLDKCWTSYDDGADCPSTEPFCGCETCCIRETLAGAWPIIERMIQHEVALALARQDSP